MRAQRFSLAVSPALLAACLLAPGLAAQRSGPSTLPALPPTQTAPASTTAPISAGATAASGTPHAAQVRCTGGELEVHAQNSSLNGILKAIARCNGMRITGGVPEQRVYGDYGPAAPATILATLIDGTGSNMLFQETGNNQPAELILTPRTGGVTPPSPTSYADAQNNDSNSDAADVAAASQPPVSMPPNMHMPRRFGQPMGNASQDVTPVPQPVSGSAVTSPQPIPQPYNNVNGNPGNTSPTASTYPTTNSVPLDSVRTPSTTPSSNGIVDAPNPPTPGSDTAAAMSGAPAGTPATTNISPDATSATTSPGATNTTVPAAGGTLTPEQIFLQLQQRQIQQQQQQQQQQQPNPQ